MGGIVHKRCRLPLPPAACEGCSCPAGSSACSGLAPPPRLPAAAAFPDNWLPGPNMFSRSDPGLPACCCCCCWAAALRRVVPAPNAWSSSSSSIPSCAAAATANVACAATAARRLLRAPVAGCRCCACVGSAAAGPLARAMFWAWQAARRAATSCSTWQLQSPQASPLCSSSLRASLITAGGGGGVGRGGTKTGYSPEREEGQTLWSGEAWDAGSQAGCGEKTACWVLWLPDRGVVDALVLHRPHL